MSNYQLLGGRFLVEGFSFPVLELESNYKYQQVCLLLVKGFACESQVVICALVTALNLASSKFDFSESSGCFFLLAI